MNYVNIKVDFEFHGVDYSGLSIEEGVEYFGSQLKQDGFDGVLAFDGAVEPTPRIFLGNLVSINRWTAIPSNYLVIAKAP